MSRKRNKWVGLTTAAPEVTVIAGDHKVEFDYWEDSLLGGFYDPARPGDVPVYRLSVYARDRAGGWDLVHSQVTGMELDFPWKSLLHWAGKIAASLKHQAPEAAAGVCPFLRSEEVVVA